MKIRYIPKYIWGENSIEFHRCKGVPGFNYMVIINGIRADWLSTTHNPNARAAKYFILKHTKIDISQPEEMKANGERGNN